MHFSNVLFLLTLASCAPNPNPGLIDKIGQKVGGSIGVKVASGLATQLGLDPNALDAAGAAIGQLVAAKITGGPPPDSAQAASATDSSADASASAGGNGGGRKARKAAKAAAAAAANANTAAAPATQ